MKAIKYIAAIALLTGLVSCQQEMKQDIQTLLPDADKVEVTFNVQFPEPVPVATKASKMGEGPVVDGFNICFCLYGAGDGYIQNWIPAELSTPSVTTNGFITGGEYKILLPLTDEKRIIHVIANPPSSANPITSDYIYNAMEKLVTKKGTDDEASYWQEIVLENGIKAVNGGPAPELQNALNDIHLVRNFAKITVIAENNPESEEYGKFSIERWTLINVPDMAYVAPYDGSINNVSFPKGYTKIATYATPKAVYDQLTDVDKYPGYFPPETSIDESFPGDPDEAQTSGNYAIGESSLYMYERPLPDGTHKQSAVLVEVKFTAEHSIVIAYNALHPDATVESLTYWYKVEMLDKDGQYIPFLRDMEYILKISGISSEGSLTAEEAYNSAYFGNISASLETASLNQLSDGKSTIYVDMMDYTFVNATGTVTLMKDSEHASQFYFIPDDSDPVHCFASVAGVCDIQVEVLPVSGYDPAITDDIVVNPNAVPDGSIKVTLQQPGTAVKKSIIRISGRKGDNVATNVNKYIYREITINLMEKQSFANGSDETRITNTPTVTGANNEVNISLYLPKDLGSSVFPIQVRVEAEKNSLSATTPDLPVSTGKSVFDAERNTYFFIRTIEYSEYCKLDPVTKKYVYVYEFPMTFYTSKPGDNSSRISISDMKGNFNPTELTLGTVTP